VLSWNTTRTAQYLLSADVVDTELGLNVVLQPDAVMLAVCVEKLYATCDVVGAVGALG